MWEIVSFIGACVLVSGGLIYYRWTKKKEWEESSVERHHESVSTYKKEGE